jgi:DNA-binding LacI/PurR family transcriptional regulator
MVWEKIMSEKKCSENSDDKSIGVIVPELKHPFFAGILDGIEDCCFQKGYSLKIGQSKEDSEREASEIKALLASGVKGILISISQKTKCNSNFQLLIEQSIPLVFFDRVCPDLNVSHVVVDDFEGGFNATEYLILLGYERIAHLAGPQYIVSCKNRYDGYRAALDKYNILFSKQLVEYDDLDEEGGRRGMRKLLQLERRPEAVFTINDPVAYGALLEIKDAGLKTPHDIVLIGFNDNPIAALIDPPLTTIAEPRYKIGKVAAEELINQINKNGKSIEPVERILKTKLVIRQSTPKNRSK